MFHINLRILLGGGGSCGTLDGTVRGAVMSGSQEKTTREGSPGRSAEVENLCPPPARKVNLKVGHLDFLQVYVC